MFAMGLSGKKVHRVSTPLTRLLTPVALRPCIGGCNSIHNRFLGPFCGRNSNLCLLIFVKAFSVSGEDDEKGIDRRHAAMFMAI